MRKAFIALSILLRLTASGWAGDELMVSIALHGPAKGKVGEAIAFQVVLKNELSNPVLVVKPGDGSESGWREPHVYYSAQRLEGEKWQDVPARGIARCGLYNPNWQNDVVTMQPGQTLDIGDWLPGPQAYFELTPGHYRFRLHYDYGGGKNAKGGSFGDVPKTLQGVRPYHLTSEPVQYTVVP